MRTRAIMFQGTGSDVGKSLVVTGSHLAGAESANGQVHGWYMHGPFASDPFRHAFLSTLRERRKSDLRYLDGIDETLNELAADFESHLDIEGLLEVAQRPQLEPAHALS